jgi:hypothetical protein
VCMCTPAVIIYCPVTDEFALGVSLSVYVEHDQIRKDSHDLPSVFMGWSVFNYQQRYWVSFLFVLSTKALEPIGRPVSR